MEETCQKHLAHIKVVEEEVDTVNNKPFPMTLMSSVPSLQHTFSCQSIWKMKIMTHLNKNKVVSPWSDMCYTPNGRVHSHTKLR